MLSFLETQRERSRVVSVISFGLERLMQHRESGVVILRLGNLEEQQIERPEHNKGDVPQPRPR